MTYLKEIIPDIYQSLFPEFILNLDTTETKATCDNCLRSRDKRFDFLYRADLKCCTFYPFLPNFAVGGILKEKLKGSDVIKRHIDKKQFTLPLGAFPTLKFQYEFLNRKKTDFGNREDLLCPYYNRENENCNIWKYRGVVCTTYHCRFNEGKRGERFWNKMNDYLSYVEMALAEECLVQLDFSPRDISDQLVFLNRQEWTKAEQSQEFLSSKEYKLFWNGYTDYEAFYLKCFDLVQSLNRQQFVKILGERGEWLEYEFHRRL